MNITFGISMRYTSPLYYKEPSDALSRSWHFLLTSLFPDCIVVPIPNIGRINATRYVEHLGINRLILSGGEDFGTDAKRDETENGLLDWAEESNIPVLGICRGMQIMAIRCGSELGQVKGHVKTRHCLSGVFTHTVNSYHNSIILDTPSGFDKLAISEDGSIEAIRHKGLPWEGWMWHPEREDVPSKHDLYNLERLFK